MSRGTVFGMLVVAGLASGLGYSMWDRAEASAPRPARVGNFVLVHDRAVGSVVPMERAEIQAIGGKQFLVGMGVRVSTFKTVGVGRPVWINLEDANTIIHFDTIEEMDKALAEGQAPRDH